MNIEQIARECGFEMDCGGICIASSSDLFTPCHNELRKFANAILEEAAKMCEEIDNSSYPHTRKWPSDCAEAIRKLKCS